MTSQAVLDDRYGRRTTPRRRRTVWVALIAVVTVALGLFAWMTLANPANAVSADATSYHLSERSVTVTFQLSAPAGQRVACAIEADDTEFGIVGWKVVEYPPSGTHVRSATVTVPIVAPATTGLVNSCWVT